MRSWPPLIDQAAFRHSRSCRSHQGDRLEPVVLHIVTCQTRLNAGPDRPRPLIRLSKNSDRPPDRPGTTLVHRELGNSNLDSSAVNDLATEFFDSFFAFSQLQNRNEIHRESVPFQHR